MMNAPLERSAMVGNGFTTKFLRPNPNMKRNNPIQISSFGGPNQAQLVVDDFDVTNLCDTRDFK